MLLLGLWLAMFRTDFKPSRLVAMWLCTPLPFSFTMAGKPWGAVSAISLLALLAVLAVEAVRKRDNPGGGEKPSADQVPGV
jgi:hypothetical protein